MSSSSSKITPIAPEPVTTTPYIKQKEDVRGENFIWKGVASAKKMFSFTEFLLENNGLLSDNSYWTL